MSAPDPPSCSAFLIVDCRTPVLLGDEQDRVFVVLAGAPATPDWPDVIEEMSSAFHGISAQSDGSPEHQRGSFSAINTGVSFGLGQKVRSLAATRLRR